LTKDSSHESFKNLGSGLTLLTGS